MKLFPHNFGETHNQIENPPGYLLSDIKRRSLSSLLDRIPRKKSPATRVWAAELCCFIVGQSSHGSFFFFGIGILCFLRFLQKLCGVLVASAGPTHIRCCCAPHQHTCNLPRSVDRSIHRMEPTFCAVRLFFDVHSRLVSFPWYHPSGSSSITYVT